MLLRTPWASLWRCKRDVANDGPDIMTGPLSGFDMSQNNKISTRISLPLSWGCGWEGIATIAGVTSNGEMRLGNEVHLLMFFPGRCHTECGKQKAKQ